MALASTSSSQTAQASTSGAARTQTSLNLQELLSDLFLVLTQKETEVIKRRFALAGSSKQTLEKIGKHFNVTRERIRQIEAKALRKLRHPSRSRKLKDYLE